MDALQFLPGEGRRPPGRVTVVALSRLTYRKGVDLLNVVVPAVCRRHPHVDFIIGESAAAACLLALASVQCFRRSTLRFWLRADAAVGANLRTCTAALQNQCSVPAIMTTVVTA